VVIETYNDGTGWYLRPGEEPDEPVAGDTGAVNGRVTGRKRDAFRVIGPARVGGSAMIRPCESATGRDGRAC
jgi:hypothetical protein